VKTEQTEVHNQSVTNYHPGLCNIRDEQKP